MGLLFMHRDETSAQRRARIYLTASYLGLVATVLMLLARLLAWPDFFQGLPIGLAIVSLALLLMRKLRDEYYERLWAAGTSWAFVALVVWFLCGPFSRELLAGIGNPHAARQWPIDWTALIAMLAFFVGFHVERLRGER
ncbi:MAG: hypothetical protein ACTHKM_10380 [Tsuneonella sp.]